MRNAYGRTFHLGTSSIWSFAGRILQLTHLHLYKAPLPSSVILFDGSAYDLRWDGLRAKGALDESPVIPSHDYAIFLINAVKFHGGQMFHLFDEDTFKENLDCFYGSPLEERVNGTSLWYIHFLLILALGKAFIRSRAINNEAPGASYFVKAMQILPDITALCRDPVASTEILCCIALYLQSVDHRNSAHVFIGQAMRVALGYGMHTAMPVEELGEPYVQRCRKAWWTTYVLDSQMTSLMGLPPSIRDADIHCELPSFSGSTQKATVLAIHIRLSCIITEINNSKS
jgi:proline utilization trans-activator